MGLGSAMAGGNPLEGREKDDFYPTPPEVTRALLAKFDFGPGKILEPAAGDYMMAGELESYGYDVEASDLNPRDPRVVERDFLTMTETDARTIITNPPFVLAEQFIEHALGVLKVHNLALVLKSTYWHAVTRQPLFARFRPSVVCPLTWRPDFLNKGRPTMECSWIIWLGDHAGPTEYLPLNKKDAK
jgi:hypothetical protein